MMDKKIDYNPRVVLQRLVARNNRIVEQQSSERTSNSSNSNYSTPAESMADNLPSTSNEQRTLQIASGHPTAQIIPNHTNETEGNQSDVTLINFNIMDILDDSTATISNAQPRNNRNLIMVLLDISNPNHSTNNHLNLSRTETTVTNESIDSKDNVLATAHVSETMAPLNNVPQSLSTSSKKNTKSPATTPDSPIVISSDSEESDEECSHNSYVTQIVTKEEKMSDFPPTEQADVPAVVATNPSASSATMATEVESRVDSQLVENQQINTSDGSNNENTSKAVVYVVGESIQKMFSIECNANNNNSEPVASAANNDTIEVAHDTVGQLEYESSNSSEDTIDRIVAGGPSRKEKSTSFDSSVNNHTEICEAIETNKKPDTIEDSVNEMNHDNDPAAALMLNDANSDITDVESDDSFGLVIDEHYESNLLSDDNDTLLVSDNERLRVCENVVETDDDPVLIINEIDAIDSINLDDSLSISNDNENITEDGLEITVQPSDTTDIFDNLCHKAENKTLCESLSVSDDEIITPGRYGARVKFEDESKLVTSFGLRIDNIRSTGTEISKTTEVIVDPVVEKENLPDVEEHCRSSTMTLQSDDDHLTVEQLNVGENRNDYSDSSEGPAGKDDKLMQHIQRKRKHSSITQRDSITMPAKRRKFSTSTTMTDDTDTETDRSDDQMVNEMRQRKSTLQQAKSTPKVTGKVRGFFRKLTSNLREKRNQLKAKLFHKKNCVPNTQGTTAGNFIITNFREERVNGFMVAPADRVFKDEPM